MGPSSHGGFGDCVQRYTYVSVLCEVHFEELFQTATY